MKNKQSEAMLNSSACLKHVIRQKVAPIIKKSTLQLFVSNVELIVYCQWLYRFIASKWMVVIKLHS